MQHWVKEFWVWNNWYRNSLLLIVKLTIGVIYNFFSIVSTKSYKLRCRNVCWSSLFAHSYQVYCLFSQPRPRRGRFVKICKFDLICKFAIINNVITQNFYEFSDKRTNVLVEWMYSEIFVKYWYCKLFLEYTTKIALLLAIC